MVAGNYYLLFDGDGKLSVNQNCYHNFHQAFRAALPLPREPKPKIVVEVSMWEAFRCYSSLMSILIEATIREGVAIDDSITLDQLKRIIIRSQKIAEELNREIEPSCIL